MTEEKILENKNEGGKEKTNFTSLVKDFLYMIEKWEAVLNNYTESSGNEKPNIAVDVIKGGYTLVSEISKHMEVKDGSNGLIPQVMEFVPKKYRPAVEAIIEKYSKVPWDITVDFLAELAKEYGRDRSNGQYRKTEDVVKDIVVKIFADKFIEKMFGI